MAVGGSGHPDGPSRAHCVGKRHEEDGSGRCLRHGSSLMLAGKTTLLESPLLDLAPGYFGHFSMARQPATVGQFRTAARRHQPKLEERSSDCETACAAETGGGLSSTLSTELPSQAKRKEVPGL